MDGIQRSSYRRRGTSQEELSQVKEVRAHGESHTATLASFKFPCPRALRIGESGTLLFNGGVINPTNSAALNLLLDSAKERIESELMSYDGNRRTAVSRLCDRQRFGRSHPSRLLKIDMFVAFERCESVLEMKAVGRGNAD
jgi:hypothetical protein